MEYKSELAKYLPSCSSQISRSRSFQISVGLLNEWRILQLSPQKYGVEHITDIFSKYIQPFLRHYCLPIEHEWEWKFLKLKFTVRNSLNIFHFPFQNFVIWIKLKKILLRIIYLIIILHMIAIMLNIKAKGKKIIWYQEMWKCIWQNSNSFFIKTVMKPWIEGIFFNLLEHLQKIYIYHHTQWW